MSHRSALTLVLCLILTAGASRAQVTESDSLALVALYNATDGANWTDNTGWLAGPVGSWFGITIEGDRVTGIEFNGNGMSGSVPVDIANLDSLKFLRLYQDDGLTGPIPPELGGLSKLEDLELYRANFTGPIPPELGNLGNLQRLYLLDNNLTGTIPVEILGIEPLRDLLIDQNELEGEIPSEIGNLTNLERLWVDFNNLTGSLPEEVGNLTKLSNLFIQNNGLTGPLPQSLTNLPSNLRFRWNDTQLCEPTDGDFQAWIQGLTESTGTGEFCEGGAVTAVAEADSAALVALYDSTDGANWTDNSGWLEGPVVFWHGVTIAGGRITEINLDGNNLTGPLPSALGNLDSLQILTLQSNGLTGPIPAELGNLVNLHRLFLNGNEMDGQIPAELGQLEKLEELSVGSNNLSGPIPPELGNLSQLRKLYLYSNNLSGEVPEQLGDLSALQDLLLEFNDLAGPIPHSFIGLALTRFTFNGTSICEPSDPDVQAWLEGINNLTSSGLECVSGSLETDSLALVAFYDSLDGPNWVDHSGWLTDSLANWNGVTVDGNRVTQIILSNNGLSGRIPAAIGDLGNLKILSISNDTLEGPLPSELWNLTNLTYLALNNTHLAGPFPEKVAGLTKLTTLSFDGNDFEGSVPDAIGNLTKLFGLFLSRNKLSGPLPESMGNLVELRRFEIGGNALEGALPAGMANWAEMSDMSLSGNQFSGPIPSFLGNLTKLRRLFMGTNAFTGEVPASLGNLAELTTLSISSNQGLTGALPLALMNLTNLTTFFFSSTGLCVPDDAGFQAWLDGIASLGSTGVVCTATAVEDSDELPSEYRLDRNYPNPFNPSTTIGYDLPERSSVHLSIHDVVGREVKVLVDKEQAAGRYAVSFDASRLPSGLYFYRFRAGNFTAVGNMILAK